MAAVRESAAQGARRASHRVRERALDAVGGPARGRVVLILAAVLGLSGADTGTISATTGNLEQAFHVGNTQIGILTDRTNRTRLLAGSVAAWAVATALSGAASSYIWLLLARVALGVVTATTGPTIASLTGDFFPAADRARMYGFILGGDLLGSGIGYVVSGDLSSLTSWRVAFWWLVLPSLVLAWLVWRLPEPARGGFSRLTEGADRIRGAGEATDAEDSRPAPPEPGNGKDERDGLAE